MDVADIPVRDFHERLTTRLISTAHIVEPALTPLADDEDERAILEELEGLTSPRRGLPDFIPAGVRTEALLGEHDGYGWTHVNAAFCYTRETGNRFNGPERGAWYAALGENQDETAKAEVSWHLSRELEVTGVFDNITSYREMHASFATTAHDIRGLVSEPFLNPDPKVGYPAGQRLAAELRAAEANGLIYPSVRYDGGQCFAAFRPHLVQNIRQGDTWTFTWAGSAEPTITARDG